MQSAIKKNTMPEFFESMLKPGIFGFDVENARLSETWKEFACLYERNYLSDVPGRNVKIPHRIHQIWLGSELPKRYYEWQKTWIDRNPGWEYKLWMDADVDSLKLKNSHLFYSLKNQGARSDILRYEILYNYGGVYADTDFECFRSFDDITHSCNFFAGIPHCRKDGPLINNALIGSAPQNSIIANCISNISLKLDEKDPNSIMEITGPSLLTDSVLQALKAGESDILILPASFFFPFPGHLRNIRTMSQARKYIEPETYAIHYWEVSWSRESRSLTQRIKDILPEIVKNAIKKSLLRRIDK